MIRPSFQPPREVRMRRNKPDTAGPAAIMDAFPSSRVVVVGDLIVDHYLSLIHI